MDADSSSRLTPDPSGFHRIRERVAGARIQYDAQPLASASFLEYIILKAIQVQYSSQYAHEFLQCAAEQCEAQFLHEPTDLRCFLEFYRGWAAFHAGDRRLKGTLLGKFSDRPKRRIGRQSVRIWDLLVNPTDWALQRGVEESLLVYVHVPLQLHRCGLRSTTGLIRSALDKLRNCGFVVCVEAAPLRKRQVLRFWQLAQPLDAAPLNSVNDVQNAKADQLASIPPLDKESGEWVRSKEAAQQDGVMIRTLSRYRQAGRQPADKMSGIDCHGRQWRRLGTRRSHPWYLVRSLSKNRR